MTLRSIAAAMTCGLLVVTTVPGIAAAQSRDDYRSFYRDPYALPRLYAPFSSRDIGISGPARTCAKWCPQDSNPCDPPEYKRADGRCNMFN